MKIQRTAFTRGFAASRKQASSGTGTGARPAGIGPRQFFKNLPKVPMTQYLEKGELSKDMLYSGYRPIMYPVKQNPLFRNKHDLMREWRGGGSTAKKAQENAPHMLDPRLFGEGGTGGIATCGVNGIWKHGPQIPDKTLPLSIWNSSCMVMEVYNEWGAVPRDVVKAIKPFDGGGVSRAGRRGRTRS